MRTIEVGSTKAVKHYDELPALIQDGDTVLFSPEDFHTVHGFSHNKKGVTFREVPAPRRPKIIVSNPSSNAIFLGVKSDHTKWSDIDVESKVTGIYVAGSNTVIQSVSQWGEGMISEALSAQGLIWNNCDHKSGKMRDKALFAGIGGGTTPNRNLELIDCDAICIEGQHVNRFHKVENLKVTRGWSRYTTDLLPLTNTYPDGTPRRYFGMNLAIKDGVHNCLIDGYKANGWGMSIGPLPQLKTPGILTSKIVVKNCDLRFRSWIDLAAGIDDVEFNNCTIVCAMHGFDVSGPRNNRPAPTNVRVVGCHLETPHLLGGSPSNFSNVVFTHSTNYGKLIV